MKNKRNEDRAGALRRLAWKLVAPGWGGPGFAFLEVRG